MGRRLLFPLAWLLAAVLLLQVVAGTGSGATMALVASALLCGAVARLVVVSTPSTQAVTIASPADRRLHGRFLQQSRPGVPGRIRSRAPGCGH